MRDRQLFETYILPNGIRIFHYPSDYPFAIMHIILPFGHVHNTGDILPGTAHFLEHMAASHSSLHPRRHAFTEWVGLQGGYSNAQTGNFHTIYLAEVPLGAAEATWEGLCAGVFDPLFQEEDITMQRTIISAERKRKERWFPGSTELGHYLKTRWQQASTTGLRQIFGMEDDLAAMDPAMLQKFHAYYRDPRVTILTGGTLDMQKLAMPLLGLKLKTHEAPAHAEAPYWEHKEYSEEHFDDVTQPILYIGAIFSSLPDYKTKVAIDFIGDFLTNSDHGPLYHWLRTEKGWLYGMSFKATFEQHTRWTMSFPLHETWQVETVRKELWERIMRAISDKNLVTREVNRKIGAQAFNFQTLESIIGGAEYDFELYGGITSEAQYREYLQSCDDTGYLKDICERFFAPSLWGEFCALPK